MVNTRSEKNVDLDSFNQHLLEKTFRSQLNGQYQQTEKGKVVNNCKTALIYPCAAVLFY
jgi:hypothetical protein